MKKISPSFVILILILPFIMPEYLVKISFISQLVKFWKIGAGSFSIIYLCKKKKTNKILLLLTLFYLIMILSAFFHGYDILDYLNFISFLWIISFLTETKEKYSNFCDVYKKIMTIIVSINLLTMIMYPNGLYVTSSYEFNWFLGYKNTLIRRILPFITIILLEKRNKFNFYEKYGIVISVLSIILSKSFNGYVGITVFFSSFYVINKYKKISSKLTFSKTFISYILLDIIMLSTNILAKFNDFIVNVLDKNGSMLGREAIWNKTITLISHSPFVGYGNIESSFYNMTFKISHPHNLLLYYLMLGGIASIIVLLISLKNVDRSIRMKNNSNCILICFYISMFSMGFLESLIGATFLIPFMSMTYNINVGGYYDRNLYPVSNK